MSEQEETNRIPTSEKLAQALELANAPQRMIDLARAGGYDDYKSNNPTPIVLLIGHTRAVGLTDIAERAMHGEFDEQNWEAVEWSSSAEAQEIFAELTHSPAPRGPRGPYKSGRTGERPRKREQARQQKHQQKGTHS